MLYIAILILIFSICLNTFMKDTSLEGFDSNLMQILPIWISTDNESIKVPNKIEGNLKEGEITFGGNLIANKQMTVGSDIDLIGDTSAVKIKGITNSTPVGAIISYLGTSDPDGWVICDGVTRPYSTKYDSLIKLGIGTRSGGYIPPNLNNRFLKQTTIKETNNSPMVALTTSNMPSHTHTGVTRLMNQNQAHSHGVSDPGHSHKYNQWNGNSERVEDGRDWRAMRNETNTGTTQSSGTGISLYNTDTNHTHDFTTNPTGEGSAFPIPDPLFYGVKFIVKY